MNIVKDIFKSKNEIDVAMYHRDKCSWDIQIASCVISHDEYWLQGNLNDIVTKPNANIVDIGTHIGSFSKLASVLNPSCNIIGIEANRNNYRICVKNLLNSINIGKTTILFGGCCGSHDKNNEYILTEPHQDVSDNTGGWTIDINGHNKGSVKTPLISLEHLLGLTNGIIDILKIDCEGSEYDIIYNSKKELFDNVHYIVIEIHGSKEKRSELIDYIVMLGFKLEYRLSASGAENALEMVRFYKDISVL